MTSALNKQHWCRKQRPRLEYGQFGPYIKQWNIQHTGRATPGCISGGGSGAGFMAGLPKGAGGNRTGSGEPRRTGAKARGGAGAATFHRGAFQPGRAKENSPAFQRWEARFGSHRVPSGTTDKPRVGGKLLPSLTGLDAVVPPDPALKRWAIVSRPSGTFWASVAQRACQRERAGTGLAPAGKGEPGPLRGAAWGQRTRASQERQQRQ